MRHFLVANREEIELATKLMDYLISMGYEMVKSGEQNGQNNELPQTEIERSECLMWLVSSEYPVSEDDSRLIRYAVKKHVPILPIVIRPPRLEIALLAGATSLKEIQVRKDDVNFAWMRQVFQTLQAELDKSCREAGRLICERRCEKQLSQVQLANMILFMNEDQVARFERGISMPSVLMTKYLAQALDLDFHSLLIRFAEDQLKQLSNLPDYLP